MASPGNKYTNHMIMCDIYVSCEVINKSLLPWHEMGDFHDKSSGRFSILERRFLCSVHPRSRGLGALPPTADEIHIFI